MTKPTEDDQARFEALLAQSLGDDEKARLIPSPQEGEGGSREAAEG